MSYDLILQTQPGCDIAASEFDTVLQDLRQNGKLQRLCEVAPGRPGASRADVVVLCEGLDFGDFSEADFTEFCSRRGLPADRQHEGAAAAFIRSRFGFPVATFKLPTTEEEVRVAYLEIVRFALRRRLRVTDPQEGGDIDLRDPGSLPPKWST